MRRGSDEVKEKGQEAEMNSTRNIQRPYFDTAASMFSAGTL